MLLALELGVGALVLVVFLVGLGGGERRGREVGLVAAVGLAGLYGLSLVIDARGPLFDGAFVVDGLAVFLKQVFLLATLLAVVGGLARRDDAARRHGLEYHLLVLTALLGMMVLASARELVLIFVAFELMSIPLYVLAGFAKKDARAVEASLKFFLVGSLSTGLLAYGLSFVYGGAGSTRLDAVTRAAATGDPLLLLGLVLVLAGIGFKIAVVPFHMWVPDTYEAAGTPFVAWLSVAPKAAGFAVLLRVFVERAGPAAAFWGEAAALLGALTIVAGNLMAIPQTDAKRLLAYSGIAHIGYMLLGVAALSPHGVAMLLFYLVAYLFSNMGAFMVVEAVGQSEGSSALRTFRGLAQRSPVLALVMLLFLLSLGGHSVRGGLLGQALHLLGRGPGGALRARAARRHSDRRRALLLSAGGQADVHRRAGPRDAGRGPAGAGPRAGDQRGRGGAAGALPGATAGLGAARGHPALLTRAVARGAGDVPAITRRSGGWRHAGGHRFQRPST